MRVGSAEPSLVAGTSTPTCGAPPGIAGNRDPRVRPQGCEGPRSDATIASDPHSALALFCGTG